MASGETKIQSTDTIHHLAGYIKDVRNKRRKNQEDLELKNENTTYNCYWAVFNISNEKNYFIQIVAEEDTKIYVEVPNKFPDPFRLSHKKMLELQLLGWMKDIKNKTSHNYYRYYDVADETACYATAAEIVLTMIKVFDYRTFETIDVETGSWEFRPSDVKKDTLLENIRYITRNIFLLIAEKLDK